MFLEGLLKDLQGDQQETEQDHAQQMLASRTHVAKLKASLDAARERLQQQQLQLATLESGSTVERAGVHAGLRAKDQEIALLKVRCAWTGGFGWMIAGSAYAMGRAWTAHWCL